MKLNFDLRNIRVTQFGVGLNVKHEGPDEPRLTRRVPARERFVVVPTDENVKTALAAVIADTLAELQTLDDARVVIDGSVVASNPRPYPRRYEPSERYEAAGHLLLPLGDELAIRIRQLHEAKNLPVDGEALSDPSIVFCYFVRMIDDAGNRLTALRRAAQFKGILKSRLLRFATDSLTLIEDKVFKLDKEFDLVTDSEMIHILHPIGFEDIGDLEGAILTAADANVKSIGEKLGVDVEQIADYAAQHPRAARVAASIKSQGEADRIDMKALKDLCESNGVAVLIGRDGKLVVTPGNELGFLEVLDRRRYNLSLIKGVTERLRANSRQTLSTVPTRTNKKRTQSGVTRRPSSGAAARRRRARPAGRPSQR